MDSPSVTAIPALSGESVHGAVVEQSGVQHRRLHSLDILRGLAACGVMIPHFFMYAGGENLTAEIISSCAVEVFFVLSGFVLGPQVLLCMNRGNLRTYGIFLVRRWMRTVPPYLIALVAVSVFTRQLWSTDFFRYSIYIGNLFDQHLTKDFFPVAWSLAVEEWYYVVFPLLMIATVPFLRQTGRQAVIVAIGFVVAIAVIRLLFSSDADWGEHTRRIVIFRIDSIAYGFLLYLFVRTAPTLRDKIPLLSLVFACCVVLMYFVNTEAAGISHRIFRDLHPFASAAFGSSAILLCIGLEERVGIPERLADFMGRISYPVYLLHLPILYFLAKTSLSSQTLWLQFTIYVALTIGLATAFNKWIEQPILKARPGY
jgi:peptidoglycan/LPS O-acetylase OafA/YrhL